MFLNLKKTYSFLIKRFKHILKTLNFAAHLQFTSYSRSNKDQNCLLFERPIQ